MTTINTTNGTITLTTTPNSISFKCDINESDPRKLCTIIANHFFDDINNYIISKNLPPLTSINDCGMGSETMFERGLIFNFEYDHWIATVTIK